MAREIQEFSVTIPAGTAKAAPTTTLMSLSARKVQRVEIKVPPGPRGVVGFQLGFAGNQLIPYNSGGFIITDDVELGWDLDDYPDSGDWQLIGYNTGVFDHTIYVRFLVDLPGGPGGTAGPLPAPIPVDQLSAPISAGGNGSALPPAPALPPPAPLPALPPPPGLAPPALPAPPPLPPPPPGLGGQVLPANWTGPPAWPLSNQDLTGVEL